MDFSSRPIEILAWFAISLALFKSWDEIRLAYFVALFTVFDGNDGRAYGRLEPSVIFHILAYERYVFLL